MKKLLYVKLVPLAYDTFLLNGKTKSNPWKEKVKAGDIVRLRFIDAGGSSMFRIKIPGEVLSVVQYDDEA